ncbi:hypothetical protein [Larkinella humicola]|uniref:Bacteriocin class II with double-glycine leader peptide n=1 Tax=Larkinella humicola TaxID=2607654 RepID=A0A5N1JK40_9BACT|nr:hypothetical protein [Larkinella humicola]KAA9355160.1 hypothetical protein F0P93_11325 [Larkinella humicola]
MKKNLKIFLHFFPTAFSVQWEVRCLEGHSTGNGGKTYIIMQKIEMCQMEDLYGGDWQTWAGVGCVAGIGVLAFAGSLMTAGIGIPAIAAGGAAGISACTAGLLGSVYIR